MWVVTQLQQLGACIGKGGFGSVFQAVNVVRCAHALYPVDVSVSLRYGLFLSADECRFCGHKADQHL